MGNIQCQNRPKQIIAEDQEQAHDDDDDDHDHDYKGASSSASASIQYSEGHKEKDLTHTHSSSSCSSSSDDMEQQQLLCGHQFPFGGPHKPGDVKASLRGQFGHSSQLASLTLLCEVLSSSLGPTLPTKTLTWLSELLVELVENHDETNDTPHDIMLLVIRAITLLCKASPESAGLLVSHDAVPALCQSLRAIETQDVADQCIQALEKLSLEEPLVCLQEGATIDILKYFDFYSASIQRVAISTVLKIYCESLHLNENLSVFIEAFPLLCNLLQYEDQQIVDNASSCLIMTVEAVAANAKSSKMLEYEFYKHGLIERLLHLLSSHAQITPSELPYSGLILLLGKLASGSVVAFRTLHDLNISSIVKDILSKFDLSHGLSSLEVVPGSFNTGYEVLILLNELLPAVTKDHNDPFILHKQCFLASHPYLLQNLGMDVLPQLIQVFNSDACVYVCNGCLSVIYKLVYFNKSDMLVELLKDAGISSFLAGALTRRNYHVLILALKVAELILEKFSDTFLSLFVKEGVFFAIDAILSPETSSQLNFSQNFRSRKGVECPCYACSKGQSLDSSIIGACKLDKDSIHNLSKRIKAKYSESKPGDFGKDIQNFRYLAYEMNTFSSSSVDFSGTCSMMEDEINSFLCEILEILTGKEQVSSYEFIESGIVDSLLNYLSHGGLKKGVCGNDAVIENRFETLAKFSLSVPKPLSGETPLSILIRKLQNALTSLEVFPAILSDGHASIQKVSFATVPNECCIPYPFLKVRFIEDGADQASFDDLADDFVTVDPFSSLDAIEGYLWPKVKTFPYIDFCDHIYQSHALPQLNAVGPELERQHYAFCGDEATQKHVFYFEGQQLDHKLTLYQAILCQMIKRNEFFSVAELWSEVHTLTYRSAAKSEITFPPELLSSPQANCFSDMFPCELVSDMEKSSPAYRILFLLKILEGLNRFMFHFFSRERIHAFAIGEVDTLDQDDNQNLVVPCVARNEFVNKKLTEKLEQQLGDYLAVSTGSMPLWWNQLMVSCPFLFSFEARCKYFKLATYRRLEIQPHFSAKFLVFRDRILESAFQMMSLHAGYKVGIEVEYVDEVGTGLGPPLEFYNLICKELQKPGSGMWREDTCSFSLKTNLQAEETRVHSLSSGLFPRPWLSSFDFQFAEVSQKFELLGYVVAKSLQDGRVLDLHFSKAFYKLILGKELSLYDIQSFDPELGRVLQEFKALVNRKKHLESVRGKNSLLENAVSFRGTKIEDLCLDFTLPGYPHIFLAQGPHHSIVNMSNLEDYVSLVMDATMRSGISRQVDAFKCGFNLVFPIKHLQVFNEEELELLLCGEQDSWTLNELAEHIKFDHGYNARSPAIANLLEIMQEFELEQRRAFLQFVSGSPRLPRGGFASLNPKLTVVPKISRNLPDTDLPCVMTCTNFLKLPPYSSKEIMKEKLLYAITEGQGSFHLS